MRNRPITHERILETAIALFQQNGYHATGIRELSEAVGLGLGTLYHHIGSKEELLFEISLSLLNDARREAEEAIAGSDDPEARLRALACQLVTHHALKRDAWSVALQEAKALNDAHRKQVVAARDRYEALWAEVLAEGATRSGWRLVQPVELWGILGMFNSTARWIDVNGILTPAQIADKYVDLLLGGLAEAVSSGTAGLR